MVSDTISSPSRAAFQLSITVLVHYRLGGVFSLATSSWPLPTGFLEPHSTLDLEKCMSEYISPTGLSPSLDPLSSRFSYITLNARKPLRTSLSVLNPFLCDSSSSSLLPAVKLASNSVQKFTQKGLDCSAFVRHYSRNDIPLLISAAVMSPQKLERE